MNAYRVLLSADAVGGVWRYAIELARGLAAQGVSVMLAVLGPAPTPAQRREAEAIPGLLLDVTGLPLDWTAESADALASSSAGLRARAREFDLAHVHAPALVGTDRWPVPVVATVHSCLLTWWRAMRDDTLPEDFAWRVDATRDGLLRADALAAPSRAFASAVREAYGLARGVATIHNGRSVLPLPATQRERAVFTAGRLWDEGKNAAALNRAAARMDVPVAAAGATEGPNGARIRLEHMTLLGPLNEEALARQYARARVFVSPARYEPFGLAVLEAAQAGMALVLSDIPSFRELWDGAALFVDPDDTDALVAAIGAALDDADALGARASARAARYSVARMAEETIALHRSVLPVSAAAD